MTDDEFLKQFENCSLAKSYFNHQGHLRMTWLYLKRYSFAMAEQKIITGIKKYAASLGASHIYHETITKAWIRIVVDRIAQDSQINTFKDFIEQNGDELSNKDILNQYYSNDILQCPQARETWIEPDKKDLL